MPTAMPAAYPTSWSATAGEPVGICISAEGLVDVEVARLGAERELLWTARGVRAEEQPVPPDAAQRGCGWVPTIEIPVGRDWRSGVHEVVVTPVGRRWDGIGDPPPHAAVTMLVVKPSPADRSDLLMVVSLSTYNAYNDWGGPSLYDGATQVSYQRPLPRGWVTRRDRRHFRLASVGDPPDVDLARYHEEVAASGLHHRCGETAFHNWQQRFVRWAERSGRQVDTVVSTDLELGPSVLDGHRCVALVGHDEYWSWEMRDTVEGFVADGGNLAVLSGNTAFWQVRHEGHVMICHKYAAPWKDPVVGTLDERRVTAMWSDPLIGRPENAMIGVSFTRGGYVRFGGAVPHGSGGYTVHRPEHWAFDGTDLAYGDVVGADAVVVGYEADGCDLALVDGRPVPTGVDGTPSNFEVLATSPAKLWSNTPTFSDLPARLGQAPEMPADLEYTALRLLGDMEPATTARLAAGHAVMGTFRATAAGGNGGEVFTTGCTDWSYGLDEDPIVQRITANVVDRFCGRTRTSRRPEGGGSSS